MTSLELKNKRLKYGLTQQDLAEKMGVSPRTIINYEQGGVIPKSKSSLFEMVFNDLERNISRSNDKYSPEVTELKVNEPYEMIALENNNANQFLKLENGQYLMTMPLAEFNIQAGLLDNYQDIEYLKGLEKHSIIVDNPVKGRYMAFRVKGDSMDDDSSRAIVQNSIVTTRELHRSHWKDKIRIKDFPYWVIYTSQSRYPLLKEITNHNTTAGTITCHSLNDAPEYTDFELPLDEVQALFYVVDVHRTVSNKSIY